MKSVWGFTHGVPPSKKTSVGIAEYMATPMKRKRAGFFL